jgi:hypothetical protein
MCTGFFSVEFVPSPKFQFHDVGDPMLWSVKLTLNGVFPEVGDAENTGCARTFTVANFESVPFVLFTVSVTL